MQLFSRLLLVLLGICALALPSAAQDFRFGLTDFDVKRLREQPATLNMALDEAKTHDNTKELRTLQALMAATPLPIADARDLAGKWRCRMMKVGGSLLPLVIYGFFECRIDGSGREAKFEKVTGSQRSAGDLIRQDDSTFVFRGVGYTDYTPRKPYGDGPDSDEVGLVRRLGPNRLRIEFPAPQRESRYNVMELVRRP